MFDKVELIAQTDNILVYIPDLQIRWRFPRKGTKLKVPYEKLESAIFDPGTEYMLKTGMLHIEDLEVKKALGLEPEDATEPQNVIVLSEKEQIRYLTVLPIHELGPKIDKLSREQRTILAEKAVELKITDLERMRILKEKTGFNIQNAIAMREEE